MALVAKLAYAGKAINHVQLESHLHRLLTLHANFLGAFLQVFGDSVKLAVVLVELISDGLCRWTLSQLGQLQPIIIERVQEWTELVDVFLKLLQHASNLLQYIGNLQQYIK